MAFSRISIAVVAGCIFGSSAAFASEVGDRCREAIGAQGGDAAMCDCIDEKVEANPGIAEELASLQGGGGGIESLSSEAQEALGQCFQGMMGGGAGGGQ